MTRSLTVKSFFMRQMTLSLAIILVSVGLLGLAVSLGLNRENVLWGLNDRTGKPILPPVFSRIWQFRNGLLGIEIPGGKVGLADIGGKILIEPKYAAYSLSFDSKDSFLRVCDEKHKCGLARTDGTLIVPLQFDVLDLDGDGPYPAERDGQFGYVTDDGRFLEGSRFGLDRGEGFHEGYAWAQKDHRLQLINRRFEVIYTPPWEIGQRLAFVGGSALVCEPDPARTPEFDFRRNCKNWHLVDSTGKELVGPELRILGRAYSDAANRNALYQVTQKTPSGLKVGLVDQSGSLVIPAEYDDIDVWNGFVRIQAGTKWGLRSISGQELIPPRYDDIWVGRGGQLAYELGEKRGFHDLATGTVLPEPIQEGIPAETFEATHRKDRWLGREGDRFRLLDNHGNAIDSRIFEGFHEYGESLRFRTERTLGIADLDGRTLVELDDVLGSEEASNHLLSEWFSDTESGAYTFAVESWRHRFARWASSLYPTTAYRTLGVEYSFVFIPLIYGLLFLAVWFAERRVPRNGEDVKAGNADSNRAGTPSMATYLCFGLPLLFFAFFFMGFHFIASEWPWILGFVQPREVFLAFWAVAAAVLLVCLYRNWTGWSASGRLALLALIWPTMFFVTLLGLNTLIHDHDLSLTELCHLAIGFLILTGRGRYLRNRKNGVPIAPA